MRSYSVAILLALTTPALASPDDEPPVDIPKDPPTQRKPTGTFAVGLGYNPDDAFTFHTSIEQPDLFRTGQRLALLADMSAIRQKLALQYDVPNIIGGLDLQTELFSTRRAYPGFTREGVGGSIGLSHRIDKHTRIYARYRVEAVETSDPSTALTRRIDGAPRFNAGTVATLGGGIVHDTLDQPGIPLRGTRFQLSGERADPRLGSDYNFERFTGSLDHARGFGPFTLRVHGHAGYVRSRDGTGVPLSERLVHDGHADVRGYALDSISPLGDNLEAIGNVELELPIWKRAGVSIAGWADAGVRMNRDPMYGPTDSPLMRHSVGFSIIWRSPIGPLRFDWAVPMDGWANNDGRDRDTQFMFGLGGWRW